MIGDAMLPTTPREAEPVTLPGSRTGSGLIVKLAWMGAEEGAVKARDRNVNKHDETSRQVDFTAVLE